MTPKIDTLKGALGISFANDAYKSSVCRVSHTRQDVQGSALGAFVRKWWKNVCTSLQTPKYPN